jgi:acetoin utilization deacetylase AcuC-like enzyme
MRQPAGIIAFLSRLGDPCKSRQVFGLPVQPRQQHQNQRNGMKVFYRQEQAARTQSFSPSAFKPALVVADWLGRADIPVEVIGFEPVSPSQLAVAHDPAFVQGILSGELRNGFGNTDPGVAASLPYTTGSLVAAAEHALLHREAVCSPTSGFHHAGHASAEGFCTFNGLMVAAMLMHQQGLAQRVGIIDCDVHWGNGTDQIIRKLGTRWIQHHTMGAHIHGRSDAGAGGFERWLDGAIQACMDCDLVIYQAGADPHVDDPLGGVLTTQQMSARDRRVFERLGHKPLVWNLAGGYQVLSGDGLSDAQQIEPVLALHRETARLHCEILG